ncbi:MAG: hypothetical protein ACK5Z5_01095 [Neisseriaceae bacterium]
MKILKIAVFILPLTLSFAEDSQWQDFENNLYIGGAYSINNATIKQFGSSSSNSGLLNLGATALFDNNLYLNLEGSGNFNSSSNFVGDWYSATLKVGYAIDIQQFNFITYVMGGYGNTGAYFSTAVNPSYGIGLLSEFMISSSWLIYADFNYIWQSYGSELAADFNKNVLNNYVSYQLDGVPSNYGINIGVKYVTDKGYYISPFFKYQNYQQSFGYFSGNINYGTLTPAINQYQFGINFGLVM